MVPKHSYLRIVGLAAWLIGVGGGFFALQAYSAKAGASRPPTDRAMDFLDAHRKPGRPLLVMAVHPRCPCTDASLVELGDLLARSHGACDAILLQYQPTGWPPGAASQSLGGVRVPVIQDPNGQAAQSLGAETSGHCVLVDAQGVIRFYGGLTIARGHAGRSPAQDAILLIVSGRSAPLSTSPVYGCALGPECTRPCDP